MICVELYSASGCGGLATLLRFIGVRLPHFDLPHQYLKDITKDALQSSNFSIYCKVDDRTDTACPVFSLDVCSFESSVGAGDFLINLLISLMDCIFVILLYRQT